MANNVLCHIVGMNSDKRDEFVDSLYDRYEKINIIDLDELTLKIRNGNVMDNLQYKYDSYKKRNRREEQKIIEKKIYKYWKTILQDKIDKAIEKNKNKKIIFIGLSTYPKNHNITVNVHTDNKFFIKINTNTNAKKIIEYNLDNYRKHIINGQFPVKFLDLEYLISKRDQVRNIYTNKFNYLLKTFNVVNNFIKRYMDQFERIANIPKLYVGSQEKLENIITPEDMRKNKIIAYTEDWLAYVSMIPNINSKIKKGFINNKKPFIEEKKKNAFDSLHTKGYVYQVDKSSFRFHQKGKDFKLVSDEPVKIIKRTYLANIYKKISKKKIKLIKFKKN